MLTSESIQNRFMSLDRRLYGVFVGVLIGVVGGMLGLMVTLLGPVITAGAILGGLAGVYVLTSVSAALYGMIFVLILLPFGTLPFSIGFTPTLLDMAIGAFLVVYLSQWMTGQRRGIRLTPVHLLVVLYVLWLLLSFVLGLRWAPPTANIIRQFAETLLSIGLVFVLVDLMRDPVLLRRLVLVVIIAIGIESAIVLILYALPNDAAERILMTLARIGYPDGGIIRYIESNPALAERAIGTWVDPNTLGGALAIAATMIAPQVFARKPVLRYRWLTVMVLGMVSLALFLSYSRTSMAAFGIGLFLIAMTRYRRFIPYMIAAGLLIFLLPQTQSYVTRFMDAFTAGDLATQMRIGEWTDSLRLIGLYPVFGVGFTGTPEIGQYANAANMYLIMASQIGLVGVVFYAVVMIGTLVYGFAAWRYARHDFQLDSIHLGYHCALVVALINAIGDLYYFRLDFQGSITLFWLTVALALASSRLIFEQHENARNAAHESAIVKNSSVV